VDPDEIRRRGIRRLVIGVGILLLVVVLTFMMLPNYFR
jgi:hypothetical protein